NVEAYQEAANSPDAGKVAIELSKLMYGFNDEMQSKLVENKVLKKIGAVDDKFRLVNDEGKLVDIDGKLIDEEGYLINADGKRVDEHGNLIDVDVDDIEYTEE